MRANALRWATLVVFAGVPIAGCDSGDSGNGTVIVPAQAEPPATPAPAPSPVGAAAIANVVIAPNGDRIEKVTLPSPSPHAETAPAVKMRTHKDFADAPLPAELQEDGGLKPLPPARR